MGHGSVPSGHHRDTAGFFILPGVVAAQGFAHGPAPARRVHVWPDMSRHMLVLAVFLATACEAPTAPGDRDSLLAAKARWQAQGSTSYSYEINRSCFCLLGGRLMQVTVRNGAVTGADYLDSGRSVELALLTYIPTIPDLFDLIESALEQRAAYFAASYDPTTGYPTRIEIDYSANAVDDEVAISARSLLVAGPDAR